MTGITLAQAEARLEAYLAAEQKILLGQRVEIDGQSLTRADLKSVQEGIAVWNARARALQSASTGRGRMRTVSPVG